MKLGLLVSFSRRLALELGTFSKIPTAHTRYFQGLVTPRAPFTYATFHSSLIKFSSPMAM